MKFIIVRFRTVNGQLMFRGFMVQSHLTSKQIENAVLDMYGVSKLREMQTNSRGVSIRQIHEIDHDHMERILDGLGLENQDVINMGSFEYIVDVFKAEYLQQHQK